MTTTSPLSSPSRSRAHLDRVPGAQLLLLHRRRSRAARSRPDGPRPGPAGARRPPRCARAAALVAARHRVAEQRMAGELVQQLGPGGLHPLALAGGQDDDRATGRASSRSCSDNRWLLPRGWRSLCSPGRSRTYVASPDSKSGGPCRQTNRGMQDAAHLRIRAPAYAAARAAGRDALPRRPGLTAELAAPTRPATSRLSADRALVAKSCPRLSPVTISTPLATRTSAVAVTVDVRRQRHAARRLRRLAAVAAGEARHRRHPDRDHAVLRRRGRDLLDADRWPAGRRDRCPEGHPVGAADPDRRVRDVGLARNLRRGGRSAPC